MLDCVVDVDVDVDGVVPLSSLSFVGDCFNKMISTLLGIFVVSKK